MDKITKKQISNRIEHLQKQGWDLGIDSAYGQYRISNKETNRNYSVRDRPAVLDSWIDGFNCGKALTLHRLMQEFPEEMQAIKTKLDAKHEDLPSGSPEKLAFVELWDSWGYKR